MQQISRKLMAGAAAAVLGLTAFVSGGVLAEEPSGNGLDRAQDDLVWSKLNKFQSITDNEWDLDPEEFWYFENPIEGYQSRTLPTEGEFISALEARNYREVHLNSDTDWKSYSSDLGKGGRSVVSLPRHINDSMLGCGHDYFNTVGKLEEADLLPLQVSTSDISKAQEYFMRFGYHSIPTDIWIHGTACRQVYPDSPPSRAEATDFARYVSFSLSDDASVPSLLDYAGPELKDEFKEAMREQNFAGDRLARVDWVEGWLNDHGFDVNAAFFDKVRDFLREHPDAAAKGK